MDISPAGLRQFFTKMEPLLDERQRRLMAGALSESFGRGGATWVTEASGMSRNTVIAGRREIEAGALGSDRSRAPGAGRRSLVDSQPGLLDAMDRILTLDRQHDPTAPLRWTTRSTESLAAALTEEGFTISADTVGRLLKTMRGYSFQPPARAPAGRQDVDRQEQFLYLNASVAEQLAAGEPAVSVVTEHRPVGNSHRPVGTSMDRNRQAAPGGWGRPKAVDDQNPKPGDRPPGAGGDLESDADWLALDDDQDDVAALAVDAVARWWATMGRARHPEATSLLVTAEVSGPNEYRNASWKLELARLAVATGLRIIVRRYPPGTSRWNRVEQRMFCFVTENRLGRPYATYRTVVQLVAEAGSDVGLAVSAEWNVVPYPRRQRIPAAQLAAVTVEPDDWQGEWNYRVGDPG